MGSQLAVTLGQCSDAGIKPQNEDFYSAFIPEDSLLESKGIAVAIADGMSGSDGGKEASQLSVRMFLDDYYGTPDSWTVKNAVSKVMSALNRWLYAQGQQKYEHARGMVTTFSALVLKSQTLYLFHVGDSRIYRLREGELLQLTRDHRIWINKEKEYLARALGIDINLEIDYRASPAQQGDIYLLTTDGVHDYVADSELLSLLQQNSADQQQAAESIVAASKLAKSRDNITCQVVRVDSLAEADKSEYYEQLTRLPFPPDLNAGHIIDGYKILRELNASSRSQVYLAEDTLSPSPRKVVLKTPSVNYEDDPNYLDLFLHEEWVARRLDSPHLIKVCNEDRQRTFLYTVVEYIEGQTLKQWMADNPQTGITQMRASIDQIARGLRSMHRLEMFHQDLKPDNILIDNNNTLKIIDFGSTRIAGLAEIKTPVEHSHILGTANYSAPEYFRGEQGTNRSDIFSLGVIAYEMLTAKLPYGEISSERAASKRYLYTSARAHNPMVPEWIDAALEKALQPHPQQRYALLSEFITDLTKPNQRLLQKSTQPLLERNPVAFWQVVALIELIALVTMIVLNVLK